MTLLRKNCPRMHWTCEKIMELLAKKMLECDQQTLSCSLLVAKSKNVQILHVPLIWVVMAL